MLVTQVYSLPPQTPCLSLPGLLQGEMLESRSKHGPSQGPEAGAVSRGLLFAALHLLSSVPSLFHIPIVPTLQEVASAPSPRG